MSSPWKLMGPWTASFQASSPWGTRSRIAPSSVYAFPSASRDRKSTRLNSSHGSISYAVFCLKKKKHNRLMHGRTAADQAAQHEAVLSATIGELHSALRAVHR